MAPLKVLIVGGGIAGPALAYWLSRIGAKITLIERSPQMRASGQQLDLRAQGVPMMQKMGIESAVKAACVREPGVQLIDTDGRVKAYFPAAESGSGKQSLTSDWEIMRGDLVKILYKLTENHENVQHLYGTTIDTFTQDEESDPDGKVHVTFKDGRKEDFDLVVGAEGSGSKTRRIMLGPDAPDPRHLRGGYIGYFSVPSMPGDTNRGTFCHLPGSHIARIIGTRKDRPEVTRVYMLMNGNDVALDAALESGKLQALKEALADIYQGGGWECDRFMEGLRHCPEADDLYITPFIEVRLPEGSWSKGRVALIGDSAQCQTANGYGTTWGLVGAYMLAGEIARLYQKDRSSPTTAVIEGAKNYEKRFRPVSTATHGGSGWGEYLMLPNSKWGIWILHTLARIAAYFKLDQVAGPGGKIERWEIPDYPELDRKEPESSGLVG